MLNQLVFGAGLFNITVCMTSYNTTSCPSTVSSPGVCKTWNFHWSGAWKMENGRWRWRMYGGCWKNHEKQNCRLKKLSVDSEVKQKNFS
jgi:hypothetical protein